MFMAKINHENLISAASAVYESGYTEQGIFRLMWYAGGKGFLLAGIVILAVMGLLSWRYVKRLAAVTFMHCWKVISADKKMP